MQIQIDGQGLPVLQQFTEDGFIDCVFKIQNLRVEHDHFLFHMASSFNNEAVGVDVRVVRGIKAGFDKQMELIKDHVYRGGVEFSRSGIESDKLLSALALLYESGMNVNRMTDVETFTAIALHQGEIDVELQPIKLKLFGNDGQSDDEDDYYESFFNLDLENGLVFWNEKDSDYRQPLVRSLAA
jgi:hypothetical protein